MDVLNFVANPYGLVPLICVCIYGFLFYKIYNLSPVSSANKWFLLYLLFTLIDGTMDFLASISATAFDATVAYILFYFFATLSYSALLGFALSSTNHKRLAESPVVRFLLFVPSGIAACFILFTSLVIVHDSTKTTLIHMMWKLTTGKLYGLFYLGWVELAVIGSIILFVLYRRRVQDPNRKIQANLYIFAFIIQMVFDIIVMDIFPNKLHIFIVQDGLVGGFILGILLAYGILKQNLFVMNPAVVASTIVDTMNDMLLVVTHEGNIEYINHAISHILGYEPQDIVGKHVRTILKDQWDLVNEKLLSPVLSSVNTATMKTQFYTKNAQSIPVNISMSTVKDDRNKIIGIVCVATDISQLIQLQDITVQRNTLGKIIESLKDAVLAFDKEHNISIYNSSSQAMFSLNREQVIGKNIADIVNLSDREVPIDIKALIEKAIHNQFAVIQKEAIQATDTYGKRTTVNVIITPVQDDAGLNLAGFIVLQNLTKEKQLEDMKLDFVSIAAHELRTPITSLRGYLSLVLDVYGKKMEADEAMMLRRANISGQRLSSLIDNLLSVSKIERGSLTVHIKSLDWFSNVKQVVSDISFQANDKNIQIKLTHPALELPHVSADVLLINEVLSNLLSNAIAYTPSGGMITVWFESTQESIVTHIRDTGEGIPKDSLPYLFTKFYRVSQPLEQGSKGTGLGLYISKSIIEMHKGKIWVESELGKGSTFSFSLRFPTRGRSSHQQ